MAANQKRFGGTALGFLLIPAGFDSSLSLNGAASGGFSSSWFARSFFCEQARTLSAVQVWLDGVTGTLGINDLVCDIYSNSASGQTPSASLASANTVAAAPTAGAMLEFTGFSLALSANTQYWIVVRNANATPASNYVTLGYAPAQVGINPIFMSGNGNSWIVKTSTNSGASWTAGPTDSTGFRLRFSDGTFDGTPVKPAANLIGPYGGTNEYGFAFVSPANVTLNVKGVWFGYVYINNAPTTYAAGLVSKLYTGSTPVLQATSPELTRDIILQFGNSPLAMPPFSSPVSIPPNTQVRVTIAAKNPADTGYGYFYGNKVGSDSNSQALGPFGGTWKATNNLGGTWTDDPTYFPSGGITLDGIGGEFTASGGGGSGPVPMIGSPFIRGVA